MSPQVRVERMGPTMMEDLPRYHPIVERINEAANTGGKDPNNQWVHAEYIENPVNKRSQCVQWAKIRYIQNVPSHVNLMCPAGKC